MRLVMRICAMQARDNRDGIHDVIGFRACETRIHKMIYIDMSRAYFYAKTVRPTDVKLASETHGQPMPTAAAAWS